MPKNTWQPWLSGWRKTQVQPALSKAQYHPQFVITLSMCPWKQYGMTWQRNSEKWGALTYLQMVNMITIKMTNSEDLLSQIQDFQENYTRIMLNSHSKFFKDLVTFTFCSMLPPSYQETTHHNITDIKNYKLSDIIVQVLQEENHWRANSHHVWLGCQ